MAKSSKKKASKKSSPKAAPKAAPKASKVKKKVSPIPAGYHTLTPYLVCKGAAQAIDFYKKAFGAKEKVRMAAPDGSVMHAELQIGNSMLMLGDPMAPGAEVSGGSGVFLYVPNVDKSYAQAIAAGAKPEMPPADMFWGDRYCKFSDPFGHKWSMGTHIEDVSPKDMKRRTQEFMAQQTQGGGQSGS